jgi:hypothetical protein
MKAFPTPWSHAALSPTQDPHPEPQDEPQDNLGGEAETRSREEGETASRWRRGEHGHASRAGGAGGGSRATRTSQGMQRSTVAQRPPPMAPGWAVMAWTHLGRIEFITIYDILCLR